jgi:hypothetical protein
MSTIAMHVDHFVLIQPFSYLLNSFVKVVVLFALTAIVDGKVVEGNGLALTGR